MCLAWSGEGLSGEECGGHQEGAGGVQSSGEGWPPVSRRLRQKGWGGEGSTWAPTSRASAVPFCLRAQQRRPDLSAWHSHGIQVPLPGLLAHPVQPHFPLGPGGFLLPRPDDGALPRDPLQPKPRLPGALLPLGAVPAPALGCLLVSSPSTSRLPTGVGSWEMLSL